jgi:predicted DNA-binding transcriptional regulator AlpA
MNAISTIKNVDPVLSLKQVRGLVLYSSSQIYRLIALGSFPDRIRLGPARVGWRTSYIVAWLKSRPVGSAVTDLSNQVFEL